jgi:hypothetical protein
MDITERLRRWGNRTTVQNHDDALEAAREIERLRAGFEFAMNWRPIETAPDDTDVIVANLDHINIRVAWRHAESGRWWRPNTGPLPASYIIPTHWMPLPSKPPAAG